MIDRPDTPHADVLLEGIWEDEVTPDDLASRALSAAQASSYAFRVASEGTTATAQLGETDVADFLESETGKWARSFIGIVRVGESLVHVAHALGELARSLQQVNLEQSEIVYQVEAEIEAELRQSAQAGIDPADRVAELIALARARAAEVAEKMVTPEVPARADKPAAGLVSGFMAFGRVPGSAVSERNGRIARNSHARNGYVVRRKRASKPDAAAAAREAFADSGAEKPMDLGFLGFGRTPSNPVPRVEERADEGTLPVPPTVYPTKGFLGLGPAESVGLPGDDAAVPVLPQAFVNGFLSFGRTPGGDAPLVPGPSSGPIPVAAPSNLVPIAAAPTEIVASAAAEEPGVVAVGAQPADDSGTVPTVPERPGPESRDDDADPAEPEPDSAPVVREPAAPAPVVREPADRPVRASGPVKFSDLLKAASARNVDPARVAPAEIVAAAEIPGPAPVPVGRDEREEPAVAPVLASGPVILGRAEPLVLTKRASPAVQQAGDAVASILGSLRGGPHGPESGLHWAAGLLIRGTEAVMAVATSDAGWLPPGVVIPAGVRVLWNMPTGHRWAAVDDPVRQLVDHAQRDGYTPAAVATTHPGRAYASFVGAENMVRVQRPGAVLPGGRSRFEATVSPARLEHIRSLTTDLAERQARALIRDLETQPIAPEHAIGIEAARIDARCHLDEREEVPPAVLEQLISDERALGDALNLGRIPASPSDLEAPPPDAAALRDRLLERAIVVATLAAAHHDIESAVYAWTYARFLSSQNQDATQRR